jgi:MYXO-CTERM domain-containing protein
LHVFQLTANTKYQLVFGPTELRQVAVVIEYIDDFLTQNGRDADGDGFGSSADLVVTPCTPPAGFAPNALDCNDGDSSINPGSAEICDGIDQNCNAVADDLGLVCRAGLGACRSEGVTRCLLAGDAASCTATLPQPGTETCNGLDDDCSGAIDDAPDLCTDPSRPTCVRSGKSAWCGCLLDLDCGALSSGRICDTATRACVEGCSELPGGNGCPGGDVCDLASHRCRPEMNAAAGSGGAPAQAGGGGTTAQAGASGPPAQSGAGGAPKGSNEPLAGSLGAHDDTTQLVRAGCGCAAAGAEPGPYRAAFVWSLLGLAFLRSRRRWIKAGRVWSLSVWLAVLTGCSGTSTIETIPSGSAGEAHQHPNSGGAAGAPSSPAGGTGGAECEPGLGEELIEHSCTHALNGPFVDVVAGDALPPPDTSDLHHTYHVEIVAEQPVLSYRAQRDGEHALMTDRFAAVRLSKAKNALPTRHPFPVEGCKPLKWATVHSLEKNAVYDVELIDAPREVNVFVEHLEAFGSAAWSKKCEEIVR